MSNRLVTRISAPFIMVTVALSAVGVLGAWYVHWLHRRSSAILALNVARVRTAREIELGLRDIQTQMLQFLLTGETRQLEAAVAPHRAEIGRLLQELEDVSSPEPGPDHFENPAIGQQGQLLLARFRRAYEDFFADFDRSMQPGGGAGVRLLVQRAPQDVLLPAHEVRDEMEQGLARTTREAQSITDRIVAGLVMMAAAGAAMGLVVGLGIARSVGSSIVQLNVPIRDAAGKLNEVVGPITLSPDASPEDLQFELRRVADEIGHVVERLQQSQREVMRAEQLAALGQIAAGLAHELRNPLTAIKILVQSASEGEASLGGRDLRVLEEEITRLEASIQTFLDFARPPKLERRHFELQSVLRPTLDLVRPRADQQNVRLAADIPHQPLIVDGDPSLVRQVVLNLLLNALDAVPSDSMVSLRAHMEASDDDMAAKSPNGRVVIEVADSGPGLPAGLADRIFEPFVSTKETGLGLGLCICKRVVEAHAGDIQAANRPEGGALFTVRLPCHNEPPG
jgi:signal transduction histidine kinase